MPKSVTLPTLLGLIVLAMPTAACSFESEARGRTSRPRDRATRAAMRRVALPPCPATAAIRSISGSAAILR